MSDKVISETPVDNVEIPSDVLNTTPEQAPGESPAVSEREALRLAIEEKVSGVVEEVVAEPVVEVKAEVKPAEAQDKVDDALKQSIQKRINKEVAKRKTAEEEVAELRAENERLKASPKVADEAVNSQAEPTIEQCEAYIIKCREEGDVKNEVAAMRYLVKLEKDAAIRAVKEEQEAQSRKVAETTTKQQSDWINLNRDYMSENPEINLSNQNGLLYKEAMKLYQDKDLSEVYADPDRISGFRRAVHDAYRHITENGLHVKRTQAEVIDVTQRTKPKTAVLADPSAQVPEESSTSNQPMSDADKVKDEILNRRRNLLRR